MFSRVTTPLAESAVEARARAWPAQYTVVGLCFAAAFISYIDRTNLSVASIAMQQQFGWTETVKGFVLSSFFIGYLLLQVVSGWLATKYGGKIVLGAAVVGWSLFTALTPPAAMVSLAALVATRIALGLGEAAVFPASINMIGRWVPVAGRSRAVAVVASGLSLGTVVALPVTGWLVREYGWPMPFYAFSIIGLLWAVLWFSVVGSGRGVDDADAPVHRAVPWRAIFRTPAVWAIIANHFCHNWTLYVLLAWLPSYFKGTFGVSLTNAGLLSAAPWLVSFAMANVAGALADALLARGRSATFVRKLMQGIGLLGPATFLLLLSGASSVTSAVLLMCGATATLAFCNAGFATNPFDIAPRYAAVVWGLSNTFATIPGIIGVFVTGWLVDRTGGYAAPFLLTAGIGALGAVLFLMIGSGERKID